MKIIGTSSEGYILDCSADEMANMLGFYSRFANDYNKPRVGDEINIDKLETKIYGCSRITDNIKVIRQQAEMILKATEKVDMITHPEEK